MARKADTPWLSDQQQRNWRAFLGGVTGLMDQLDRELRAAHGLSLSEYEILVRLSEAPARTLRMAELADQVALSRSRLTHTVSRLEAADVVRREPCDDDGRGVQAVLTRRGLGVLRKAADTHVRGVREHLLAHTSADELDAIGDVMERVITDLHGKRF
ncbi:MAG: MarR family winged helix-turn-helix transcriptional regulator [Aeromicrobium sp.]